MSTAFEQVKNLLKKNLGANRELIILLNRAGNHKSGISLAKAVFRIDPVLGQECIALAEKAKAKAIHAGGGVSRRFSIDSELDKY